MEDSQVHKFSYAGDFSVGRGRGVLAFTPLVQSAPGSRAFASPEFASAGRGRLFVPPDQGIPPLSFDVPSSTVLSDNGTPPSQLSDIIKQIGSEIGESIRASLLQSGVSSLSPACPPNQPQQFPLPEQCGSTFIDASKLNLVVKSDVSPPPFFRGDGSDKYSVLEWEELMGVYLEKRGYTGSENVGEVMSRLMGRARDVTKVWMRNNPVVTDVKAVFSVLKQHFGDTVCSGMPLADFYSIKPYANEGPIDFWIRLNKAAEAAKQYLVSEGRTLPNECSELAVMFVRNCPDKELAQVFKSKPLRDWTASEVQNQLDELLRERKACRTQLSQQVAAVFDSPQEGVGPVNRPKVSSFSQCGREPDQAPSISEGETLEKVLTLLEKALVSNTQSVNRGPRKQFHKRQRECAVCGSTNHWTKAHCQMHQLCFKCFSPGHMSFDCSEAGQRQSPGCGQTGRSQEN